MRAIDDDRDASLPPDLMATLYRRYETAKARAGRIDFEDMLELTIGLIEADDTIAAEVRDRYRWFSVDEYQDTNPLQAALLDAWLGGRQDLAVVGDEDQTIYTFTGATSDYLIGFEERYPDARVVRLETNYRSTPEVLALANSVLAAGRSAPDERLPGVAPRPPKRLVASNDSGPRPEIGGFATDEAELAGITAAIRALARAGTEHGAMAILVRTNAQLPAIEAALGAAGIPFHVRGERFFARPEVRRAMRVAGLLARVESEDALVTRLATAFERELGVRRDTVPDGEAAAERHGAVVTLLELAEDLARTEPAADVPAFLAEVERRTAGRGRRGRDRCRAPDLPPRQGPRVGCGLPPGTRGGHAADPPIDRPRTSSRRSGACSTSGSPGRGDICGCRGPRPGRPPRDAVAGATARGSSMDSCRRQPAGSRRPRPRGRAAANRPSRSTRPTGRRSRMRSVPGARPVPAPTPSPHSSSSTTRPSRPSQHAGRGRWRSCAAFRASGR